MARTVFLTGINGFIGREIAVCLLRRGDSVVGSMRSLDDEDELRDCLHDAVKFSKDRLNLRENELLEGDGWFEAMQGCDRVIHTASPVPIVQPARENDIIEPAVKGCEHVLDAAARANVKRVIVTSSVTAITEQGASKEPTLLHETHWSNTDAPETTAYAKSKTLAERAAWDIASKPNCPFSLTTLLPGITIGPVRSPRNNTSIATISRLLDRADPMLPNFGFPYIDVRDVAECHVDALDNQNAMGKRIALVNGFLWYPEVAAIIDQHFPELNVVTTTAPSSIVRAIAPRRPELTTLLSSLDRQADVSNAIAKSIFGDVFTDLETAIIDTVRSIKAMDGTNPQDTY